MLFIIAAILVVFWIAGLCFRIAGGFIHLFLVLAVIVVLVSLFSGHSGSP
jgi:Family of unknown function (DUF5670)